jgi:hypothetical protein
MRRAIPLRPGRGKIPRQVAEEAREAAVDSQAVGHQIPFPPDHGRGRTRGVAGRAIVRRVFECSDGKAIPVGRSDLGGGTSDPVGAADTGTGAPDCLPIFRLVYAPGVGTSASRRIRDYAAKTNKPVAVISKDGDFHSACENAFKIKRYLRRVCGAFTPQWSQSIAQQKISNDQLFGIAMR